MDQRRSRQLKSYGGKAWKTHLDPGGAPLAQDYVISLGLTASRCGRGGSLQQPHSNYGAEFSPPPAT